jgi:hypothetical protein
MINKTSDIYKNNRKKENLDAATITPVVVAPIVKG